MTPKIPDPGAVEACGANLLQIINHAALAIMISIGHRLALFDTMTGMTPATSKEIADQAHLNERYVREWLGAMVVGNIVQYDASEKKYFLSPEQAACLTRQAGSNNMAAFAQYIPLLGSVERDILDCFKNGGGVPYSRFEGFFRLMAEDSGQSVLPELFSSILPLVPGLMERLGRGIDVLDVGCGMGLALIQMAERFPQSRFTGYDFSEEAIAEARSIVRKKELKNICFVVKNVSELGERDSYDMITTFDAIHDQAKPDKVLREIQRALRPDGVYLMQDIASSSHLEKNLEHPLGPFLYTVSCMHCMTVSLALNGTGLGTMWGRETARNMLQEAGFTQVDIYSLPHDVQNEYYVIRKN